MSMLPNCKKCGGQIPIVRDGVIYTTMTNCTPVVLCKCGGWAFMNFKTKELIKEIIRRMFK